MTETYTPKPLSVAPAGLRLIAQLFDHYHPDDPNPEVQTDLRHWADLIEAQESLTAQPKAPYTMTLRSPHQLAAGGSPGHVEP